MIPTPLFVDPVHDGGTDQVLVRRGGRVVDGLHPEPGQHVLADLGVARLDGAQVLAVARSLVTWLCIEISSQIRVTRKLTG